ncbi:MAG: cation diffusion facilitator family transporter [Hyphomicrobium sp.]
MTGQQMLQDAGLQRVAAANIGVALAVLALKTISYQLTGSVALYSDALESIVNVLTAVVAFVALRISAMPADRGHPFGHHKAEYLSSVVESVLVILAAIAIFREAYFAFVAPRLLTEPVQGLAVNGLATIINAGWSWYLIRYGRRHSSPALVADGWHLVTDVVTSAGVLAGLVLALASGLTFLDPLMAALVALNILWAGYRIAMMSFDGLMDRSADAGTQTRIREAILLSGEGALEAHDIRTRSAGRATFIEFHLVVPGFMSVENAHAICDRIETTLQATLQGVDVSIHVEPDTKMKAQARGTVDLRGP